MCCFLAIYSVFWIFYNASLDGKEKKSESDYNMGLLIIIFRGVRFLRLNISCSDISVQTQVSSSKKNRERKRSLHQ